MIHIYNERIENIPVLHVVQANKVTEQLPTVIYYHGFTSEKESSLTLAYKLAEHGVRVILPDSYLHGERARDMSLEKLYLSFWDVVLKNIEELETIVFHLRQLKLIDKENVFVGGTSIGAITTYGALCAYDWITGALAFMGSPNFIDFAKFLVERFNKESTEPIDEQEVNKVLEKIAPYDLAERRALLNGRPLFIWHGTADSVVPIDYNEQFYEQLQKEAHVDNVYFVREKDRAHHISTQSTREATAWFVKLLKER